MSFDNFSGLIHSSGNSFHVFGGSKYVFDPRLQLSFGNRLDWLHVICLLVDHRIEFSNSRSCVNEWNEHVGQILSVGASHLSTAKFVGKGGFGVLAALMLPCWIYSMFFYRTLFKKQEADEQNQELRKEIEESELNEYGKSWTVDEEDNIQLE